VIEFSKENKKIILSHSRIHEDLAFVARTAESEGKNADQKNTKRAVKIINENLERTTLGDLDVLAGLKEDLEKEEEKSKKK
jgi:small subunit ribosomal protein S1